MLRIKCSSASRYKAVRRPKCRCLTCWWRYIVHRRKRAKASTYVDVGNSIMAHIKDHRLLAETEPVDQHILESRIVNEAGEKIRYWNGI